MTQIENDVLTVLSTLDIDGNNVTITGQLDRKLYLAVHKSLNTKTPIQLQKHLLNSP